MNYSVENPLIVSYSGMSLFRKCRKAFELGYVRNIDPGSSEAQTRGSTFHEYLADYARYGRITPIEPDSAIADAAMEYVARRIGNIFDNGLPYLIEEPLYFPVWEEEAGVFLRTTPDLVLLADDGWIEAIDYKTFSREPTLDVDLDPQGGLYIAMLMRVFDTPKVRFRYEYVRTVPPGTRNSKGVWTEEQCYITVPLVLSTRETDTFWTEMQDTMADLVRAIEEQRLYRCGTRVEFGSPCLGCNYKNLCKAELDYTVDDSSLDVFGAQRREPVTFNNPEGWAGIRARQTAFRLQG
jgi:hypothetical protein